ncbi:hypothetical protein Bca101_051538 [Brassica carinata]
MQANAPADVSETSLSSLIDDKFLRSLSDVRDVDEALKIVTIDSDPTAAKMKKARAKEEDKGRRAEKSSAVHKV